MGGRNGANSTLVHFPFKVSTSGQRSVLFFPFFPTVCQIRCQMGYHRVPRDRIPWMRPSMKNRAWWKERSTKLDGSVAYVNSNRVDRSMTSETKTGKQEGVERKTRMAPRFRLPPLSSTVITPVICATCTVARGEPWQTIRFATIMPNRAKKA